MSKMSNLHAETAADRADSAENEAEFLKSIMRIAYTDCEKVAAILHETANPNSIIATDLIERLNRIIDGLRRAAGDPPITVAGEIIEVNEEF